MAQGSWRQVKLFAFTASAVLQPGVEFKSAGIPALFGIPSVDVTEAHIQAARAEVATWKNQPAAAESMIPRIAWWTSLGEELILAGIGPHSTDKAGEPTGISPAISYVRRTENRTDITPAAKARGFLSRLGLDPGAFKLPENPIEAAKGGNPFAGGFKPPEAPAAVAPAPVQPVLPASGDQMTRVAQALRASGFSAVEVAQAIASMK